MILYQLEARARRCRTADSQTAPGNCRPPPGLLGVLIYFSSGHTIQPWNTTMVLFIVLSLRISHAPILVNPRTIFSAETARGNCSLHSTVTVDCWQLIFIWRSFQKSNFYFQSLLFVWFHSKNLRKMNAWGFALTHVVQFEQSSYEVRE